MRSLLEITCQLTVAVLLIAPLDLFAQTQDPLIGTWNMSGALSDGSGPFIAVMSFNAGGTTVEFDTGGTNSSASPGESINLGKWSKTASGGYTFKDENYIYDSSGNLADININFCRLSVDASLNKFKGTCEINFYTCSLTSCPGTFVGGGPANISGKRF